MARRLLLGDRRLACETERKLDVGGPADAGPALLTVLPRGPYRSKVGRALSVVALCALAAAILLGTPVRASAQAEPATAGEPRAAETPAAAEAPTAVKAPTAVEGETHEAAEHEEGLLPVVARLVNFAILIGTLVYLLRSPLATYLKDRGTQIRSDLINAAELKRTAAAQLEEIDRKMKALPGELEALRAQGAQEIAAEETRIRAAAGAERDRLLDQARRDIDQHVKVAERELVNHAADLAVGVAAERIKRSITDDDQRRLADRYVQQLKGAADGQR
jgi:F-type H+-transporting ATPase subunit b